MASPRAFFTLAFTAVQASASAPRGGGLGSISHLRDRHPYVAFDSVDAQHVHYGDGPHNGKGPLARAFHWARHHDAQLAPWGGLLAPALSQGVRRAVRRLGRSMGVVAIKSRRATKGRGAGAEAHWGDDLDGFARAQAFNSCRVKYRAPSWEPLPLASAQQRLVYFLHGRSGSNTLRDSLKKHTPGINTVWDPYDSTFTRFTFVRDPVPRMISAWFESKMACSAGFNVNLKPLDPASSESRASVLGWFEEYVGRMEAAAWGGAPACWGPHEAGQRGRLPSPEEGAEMHFVGALSRIGADWEALAKHQRDRFGVEIGELHAPVRETDPHKLLLLNASLLPPVLIWRICVLYLDDYCCFRLPIPAACSIDCESAAEQ
mmetsp:Transcript_47891/g.135310  ORF Transcript_47891/g.135310 Transcript_47891/m.135310 type:complete len:375 (-) Transcript_47891:16-1140(-)